MGKSDPIFNPKNRKGTKVNQMGCLKLPCRCEADLELPYVSLNEITYFPHYYATGEDMLCDHCRTDPSHGMEKNKRYHLLDDEAYVYRIKDFKELERSMSKYIKLGFKRIGYCTGKYNLMPGKLRKKNTRTWRMGRI